jgi:hypothetical protein
MEVSTQLHAPVTLLPRKYRVKKSLCAPVDYSVKARKMFETASITYHDNVVRIRDNRWR